VQSNLPASITQAAKMLDQGACTPLDLVDACLAQIEQLEPEVRAWVSVDAEGAQRDAKELDRNRQAKQKVAPLWGIPLAIKDVFDVADQPTLAGSRLRAGHCAPRDCFVVQQLRRAGAIILGKTVTTEFACFDPPITKNPWELSHTPGGSSSGSAVALALGMCLGALGTQTGGSIIRPASYCGVYGLKPTYGLLSMSGVVRVTTHLDHAGPMARSVRDLALLLDAMDQADPLSPTQSDISRIAHRSATAWVDTAEATPKLTLLSERSWGDSAAEPIKSVFAGAVARLRSAGATVAEADWPDVGEIRVMHRRIMTVEAVGLHRENYPARRADYSPQVRELLDEGSKVTPVEYADAIEHQRRFCRVVDDRFGDEDAVLVMPATDTAAPGLETTGSPRFQSPWSYCGLPAVTIPCGLTEEGLPSGLQLIGRRWGEGPLLAAAAWCEDVLKFSARPPLG
jgi:aspartyl-tRNA(Asn)/glutamyl-tRNA(Gln) amidotransferase subunit A